MRFLIDGAKLSLVELIRSAETLASTDMNGAIAKLEEHRESSLFFPWIAFSLAKLFVRCGRENDAVCLNAYILKASPNFIPSLAHGIALNRYRPSYAAAREALLSGVAERIEKGQQLRDEWLKSAYLEALIGAAPNQLEKFLRDDTVASLVAEVLKPGVVLLADFVTALRDTIAAKPEVEAAKTWSFGFLKDAGPVGMRDGVAVVNLQPLQIDRVQGWEQELAAFFFRGVDALMGWKPYLNDNGTLSLSDLTEKDDGTVTFWKLLQASVGLQCAGRVRDSELAPIQLQEGGLWVRPGNVELWALCSLLRDRELAMSAALDVAEQADRAAREGVPFSANDPWWPRLSAPNNILRMATNAGWYAKPRHAASALNDWGARYLEALSTGNIIASAHTDEHLSSLASLMPALRSKVVFSWSDALLLERLNCADVVLVSAFAPEIQAHFDSGRLYELWDELGISTRLNSLFTCAAVVSIWPNYPASSWSESFAKLAEEASSLIVPGNPRTIFLSSCGAYGLPLSLEIYQRFGVPTIYYGHALNLFFGIYTNAFKTEPLYQQKPDSQNWLSIDLRERYESIASIDLGRYVVGA